jgi:acetyl-CoA carboxylase carboxyl transferase subunit beta
MAWFKRKEKGLLLLPKTKWTFQRTLVQISNWKIIDADELARNLFVSPEDGFHVRIGSTEYFQILFDNNEFVELDKNMTSKDPLHLWTQKICRSIERCDGKTKLKDAPPVLENQREKNW